MQFTGSQLTVECDDGRQLEVFTTAPESSVALILAHGTPSCGTLYPGWCAACAGRGIRLVGYSRPGYGGSTRQPDRSIADCASDVKAIAAALGAEQFYVVGHSGGGAHALACAALLPEQVIATATIAAAAPRDAEGLDWFAGQLADNIEEFEAAVAGGERLRDLLNDWRAEMLGGTGDTDDTPSGADDPTAGLNSFISAPDQAAITPETSAFATARRTHALAAGIWGWYDDDLTETKPWGFDPTAIQTPVAVWHGGQDRFVPFAHGEWLAANIPHARPHLIAEEGHFSIIDLRFGDIVDDLISLGAGR